MDEPVISKFYTNYYIKAVCGEIIVLLLNGYMTYLRLFVNLANPGKAYFFSVFFSGLLCVYFYFFSKSWKRIHWALSYAEMCRPFKADEHGL